MGKSTVDAHTEQRVMLVVAIAAYNVATTIRRTVVSLQRAVERVPRSLTEAYGKVQILLVDDCSRDASVRIAREACPEIEVVRHRENRGLYAVRRTALDRAYSMGARYVTFIDADDTMSPDALANALQCMVDSGADIVQMRIRYRLTALHIAMDMPVGYDTTRALEAVLVDERAFPVQMCGKVYSCSFLQFCSPITQTQKLFWGEDRLFNLPVMDAGPKIEVCHNAVYYYYWGGATRRVKDSDLAEYRRVRDLKRRFALDNNLTQYLPRINAEYETLRQYHIRRLVDQGSYSRARRLSSDDNVRRLRRSPKRIVKKIIRKLL